MAASTATRAATRIGIIGGGPGGLATAIALKSKGFHNTRIYERATAFNLTAGAGFGFTINGAAALAAAGADMSKMIKIGTTLNRAILADEHGNKLGETRMDLVDDAVNPAKWPILLPVIRAEFIDVLQSCLPEGTVHFGKAPSAVNPETGLVSFADGSSEEFDVIIGADGIRSTVRASMFGADAPTYSGYGIYYGVSVAPEAHPLLEKNAMAQCLGRGMYVIAVPTTVSRLLHTFSPEDRAKLAAYPDSRQPVYFYGLCFKQPDPSSAAPENWNNLNSKDALVDLMNSYTSSWRKGDANPTFGGLMDVLLAATPSNRLMRIGLHYRVPLTRWHKGRAILIGDAAHAPLPTTGQGANMAVEDAFALADELSKSLDASGDKPTPDAVGKAFEAFHTRRYKKTAAIVEMGKQIIGMEVGVENSLLASLRNSALKLFYNKGWMFQALKSQVIKDLVVPLSTLAQVPTKA